MFLILYLQSQFINKWTMKLMDEIIISYYIDTVRPNRRPESLINNKTTVYWLPRTSISMVYVIYIFTIFGVWVKCRPDLYKWVDTIGDAWGLVG